MVCFGFFFFFEISVFCSSLIFLSELSPSFVSTDPVLLNFDSTPNDFSLVYSHVLKRPWKFNFESSYRHDCSSSFIPNKHPSVMACSKITPNFSNHFKTGLQCISVSICWLSRGFFLLFSGQMAHSFPLFSPTQVVTPAYILWAVAYLVTSMSSKTMNSGFAN